MDWRNLRTWAGSQPTAFEELCCQLAAREDAREGALAAAQFERKGAGADAGVECYWKSDSLGEWAWQAKFFEGPPTDGQWAQSDDSVKTAIAKHGPSLTRYYVCLPTDLPDARQDGKISAKDRWDVHVKKWAGWAADAGGRVEFVYWGSHEIWERLSRDEHAGRRYFWFNATELSQDWFEQQFAVARDNAGPRYTPELNVGLPIATVFDGLGRTDAFFRRILAALRDVNEHLRYAPSSKARDAVGEAYDKLATAGSELDAAIRALEHAGTNHLPLDHCLELIDRADEACSECVRELPSRFGDRSGQASRNSEEEPSFASEHYHLGQAWHFLRLLRERVTAHDAQAANSAALLVAGDAGVGKTHLLRDAVRLRLDRGDATLFLLGRHFTGGNPWSWIGQELGLTCRPDDVLAALDACAEAAGRRALICIDALNEGAARYEWHTRLPGMLASLRQYPRVALAVSVRTSCQELLIPQDLLDDDRLTHIVHFGFSGHEFEATQVFFDHYNVPAPSFPHLAPEFGNPLFLTLLCESLRGCSPEDMPSGAEGMTAIFERYLEHVNDKLARPDALDFDRRGGHVRRAVMRLATRLAESGLRALPREEACTVVDADLPRTEHSRTLFQGLVDEGVLVEDPRRPAGAAEPTEVVLLSYERFADYTIALHLMERHITEDNVGSVFLPGGRLHDPYVAGVKCWEHRGVMEALSVLIPEQFGRELIDIVPENARTGVLSPFIWSVIWRAPGAFSEGTGAAVQKHILAMGCEPGEYTFDEFMNAVLTVATTPDHPYNADALDSWLAGQELADRDSWWSIYLHYQEGEQGAVERLLQWAWSVDGRPSIGDEAARLACTALAWMLTTPNRSVRDRATKGLVCLLQGRLPVLQDLLARFADVNDPYVLERLYAVAYGCALRTADEAALASLAVYVYARIFADGRPPAHILLRDYARGVIEVAVNRDLAADVELDNVRPPYESDWPTDIPTAEEVASWSNYREDASDSESARSSQVYSVMEDDFSRRRWHLAALVAPPDRRTETDD